MPISPTAVRLQTSPFQEDQLQAFQRNFRPHMQALPLRNYVYAYSPLEEFADHVKAALDRGELIGTQGHLLDAWA